MEPPRDGSAPEEAAVADIDVVKGRASGWIWWVLAAVVVVLVLLFTMRGRHANADAPGGSPRSSNTPAASLVRVA